MAVGTVPCPGCGKLRHPSAFAGDETNCRYCKRSLERENSRSPYKVHKRDHLRQKNHLTKYGLTADDFERMVETQGNRCAICGDPPSGLRRVLNVDHCHESGAVRELLCTPCNTALGQFRDRPDLLRAAADYLERHARQRSA